MATVVESAQQKDHLCGPFWAARVLRELGIDANEDDIAARAGTILPHAGARNRLSGSEPLSLSSVPPGAASKTDYTFELPTGPPEESGTSAQGLLEAIETAGASCIPIRGPWSAEPIVELFEAKGDAYLLANVRTGPFWSSKPPVEVVIAELAGEEADGGPHDWDVGHFVRLEGLIGGRLVLVHDSYPTLGWNGRHLQPTRLVAAALERGDGREGGVLAIYGRGQTPPASDPTAIGLWDNGTRR
jgi:hypothetical protein